MSSLLLFAHICISLALFITTFAIIPQLYLNMKLKTVSGLSDGMLLGLYNLTVIGTCFVYYLEMPLQYQLILPISVFLLLILVAQRLYYNFMGRMRFIGIFIINNILLAVLFIGGYWCPYQVGVSCSWISFSLQFVYQLPQVVKIIRTRSTYGFSFNFIALMSVGYLLELIAACILKLPAAIFANDIRALVMFCIFACLFYYFPSDPKVPAVRMNGN